MKNLKNYDEIIERVTAGEKLKNEDFPEIINTLYWAYRRSRAIGLETIDFSEPIWDEHVEPIVTELRKAGFEEFTISSTYSGLLETIQNFIDLGCTLQGLRPVEQQQTEYDREAKEERRIKRSAAVIRL